MGFFARQFGRKPSAKELAFPVPPEVKATPTKPAVKKTPVKKVPAKRGRPKKVK